MHLLSFFLFCKEIPYAMCQTIHTYFPRLLLPTYPILFAICSHFIHIHVHTFERQLHVIYSRMFTLIWKQFHVAPSLEKQFLYYSFTFLKGNFISYVPILRSIFVPFSTHMHICKAFSYLFNIHMYMVNNIFTPSRYKENMVQPKPSAGLKGKPHQHALTFMPSCISKKQRLRPLVLCHVLAFILTFASCTHPKNGTHTCTNPI